MVAPRSCAPRSWHVDTNNGTNGAVPRVRPRHMMQVDALGASGVGGLLRENLPASDQQLDCGDTPWLVTGSTRAHAIPYSHIRVGDAAPGAAAPAPHVPIQRLLRKEEAADVSCTRRL